MSHYILGHVPVPGTGTKLSRKRSAFAAETVGLSMSHSFVGDVPVPGTGTKLSRKRCA